MVRIDLLIFGYRKIKIAPGELSLATSLLLRNSIPSKINPDGTFSVRERDMERLETAFDGKVEYEKSELLGLLGRYRAIKNKAAIISAVILSAILTVFLSSMIWDIRIDGNETIPDAAIEYALSDCGLEIGDFWIMKSRSRIEAELLSKYPSLAWVNINKRGTVAYITVAEKEGEDESGGNTAPSGYANIVSAYDCVIEEITVTRGVAVVKRGDSVKRGDILISGVVSVEGEGSLCYAEGSVIGRISDSVSVNVDRQYTKKLEKKEILVRRDIKIFDFSLNIFKRYRNSQDECDIIEDVKVFSLFGKCKLPISITSVYAVEYISENAVYNDAELVRIASARLNSATLGRLVYADLLKIRTRGGYTDTGYGMSSDIQFLADVGKALPFEAE